MWRNRVALVTGASRGIGAAFAEAFASKGGVVVLTGRSAYAPSHRALAGTLHDVAKRIQARGQRAHVHELDVRDADRMREVLVDVKRTLGRLDVLVNNASAIDVSVAPPVKSIDLMQSINARGTLLMNSACIEELERYDGRILTLSPPLDNPRRWLVDSPAYCMSKYGMTMATLAMSERVRANCLWPARTIATAATAMLEAKTGDPYHTKGRSATYFADAMIRAIESDATGQTWLDEDLLPHADDDAPLDMFVTR